MDLKTEILLDASSAEAWRVLGQDFAAIGRWSATLRTSSLEGELGVGAIRTCEGVGFGPFPPGQVTEELTSFNPETMSFAYVATSGLPWFVEEASNEWSIDPVAPGKCRVCSHARVQLIWWMRPLGFLMPLLARRDMEHFCEELKHQVERGCPHPRKASMNTSRSPTPSWFWPIAVSALAWGLLASGAYLFESYFTLTKPEALPSMIGQANSEMVLGRSPWVVSMYGLLTLGGLFGGVLLVLRKRAAVWPLKGALFGALALQFYWWAVIDIARDWPWPVGITTFVAFVAWFAHTASRKGWIGRPS